MAQQTAVEWLFAQIPLEYSSSRASYEKLKQAMQMEKEQIMDAYINGEHQQGFEAESEQYYNEKYNK